jgi:hypothetical protein
MTTLATTSLTRRVAEPRVSFGGSSVATSAASTWYAVREANENGPLSSAPARLALVAVIR